ncbi:sugar transferase [Candidatus Saccharibacteria bacterium]|nr:sugar transferase [Candidatus Saccharibacteria bacterium]
MNIISYRQFGKRFFDVTLILFTMPVLLPVILIISLLTWANLGRPILFAQLRPGKNGEPYRLYKFRTMTNAMDGRGKLLPDEARLTSFGAMLRSTSLDELPELYNVIEGKMSLVGPRPLLIRYLDRYTPEQMRRHDVRPGITGWAQINGRNSLTWDEKFELDLWYLDNLSFRLDIEVLWRTVLTVIRREGIQQEGHATVEEFKGRGM